MELTEIFQCLADPTRLRVMHLLAQTPLCVCHFQEILDEPQVKISKHLAYLRGHGLVETARDKNWVIYSLPAKSGAALDAVLAAVGEIFGGNAVGKRDLCALARVRARRAKDPSVAAACC